MIVYGNVLSENTPIGGVLVRFLMVYSLFSRYKARGAEFIPIHNDPALIAIVAHLARDHLDWHANFHGRVVEVG